MTFQTKTWLSSLVVAAAISVAWMWSQSRDFESTSPNSGILDLQLTAHIRDAGCTFRVSATYTNGLEALYPAVRHLDGSGTFSYPVIATTSHELTVYLEQSTPFTKTNFEMTVTLWNRGDSVGNGQVIRGYEFQNEKHLATRVFKVPPRFN